MTKYALQQAVNELLESLNFTHEIGTVTRETSGYHAFIHERRPNSTRHDNAASLVWSKDVAVYNLSINSPVVLVPSDTENVFHMKIEQLVEVSNAKHFPNLREALIYIRLSKLLE